jgi:hypothetical protein
VFVASAALRVAAAAAGSAVAAVALGWGPRALLAGAAVLTLAGAAVGVLERTAGRAARGSSPAPRCVAE